MYTDILNSFLELNDLIKVNNCFKNKFEKKNSKNPLHIETLKVYSSLSKYLFTYYNVGPLMLLGSKLTSKYLVTS